MIICTVRNQSFLETLHSLNNLTYDKVHRNSYNGGFLSVIYSLRKNTLYPEINCADTPVPLSFY